MLKVVDLFAGPGGLAEGFSAARDATGKKAFEIALSVEKEASAFATLRLRSFVRQFGCTIPEIYYRYLAGTCLHADLIAAHPRQWDAACSETLQLELGADGSAAVIDPLLDRIKSDAAGRAILVGGPPCQAYSLAGRSRNVGKLDYVASEDARHFLYREYIRILARLRPAAFVMENVKGFLSAKIDEQNIFGKVVEDLRSAGGSPDSYTILPLSDANGSSGQENIIRAEQFGIPQKRHRVILFGVRKDIADRLSPSIRQSLRLERSARPPSVRDVLWDMPKLRSRLSRGSDTPAAWRIAAISAFRFAAEAVLNEENEDFDRIADALASCAIELEANDSLPPTSATTPAGVRNNVLAAWLVDPRVTHLPNHVARAHMGSDLARYAFAAAHAKILGRSPNARDFPAGLAPDHRSWASGKFADRFRVQCWRKPSTTITCHIAKDGHYFVHPDPMQCRSLTVREAARLQTFPDNYAFEGNRTQQYTQVGNAVPPLLARQIAEIVTRTLSHV